MNSLREGENRLVGNQVSLHATKRISSRFLRDDGKHKGTFENEAAEWMERKDEIALGRQKEKVGMREVGENRKR